MAIVPVTWGTPRGAVSDHAGGNSWWRKRARLIGIAISLGGIMGVLNPAYQKNAIWKK